MLTIDQIKTPIASYIEEFEKHFRASMKARSVAQHHYPLYHKAQRQTDAAHVRFLFRPRFAAK